MTSLKFQKTVRTIEPLLVMEKKDNDYTRNSFMCWFMPTLARW